MSLTAAQTGVNFTQNEPFLDIRDAIMEAATIHSTTIDADNTPTTQLRRGLVLGYDSASLKFVDAADALVDANTQAVVTASETADTDWDGETITVQEPEFGNSVTVTLAGSDDTDAEVVTALNANHLFTSFATASVSGSRVVITAHKYGTRLEVTSSLSTAFGASGTTSTGTKTKHGILLDPIPSMLGIADAAIDRRATIVTGNAVVMSANLLGITDAARQWFRDNNIILK